MQSGGEKVEYRHDGIDDREESPLSVLTDVGRAVGKFRWRLLFWCVACILACAVYAHSIPVTYTASSSILLDPRRQSTTVQGQDQQPVSSLDIAQAESQLQLIKSERMLITVFDGLGLNDSPEFRPANPGAVDSIIALIKQTIFGNNILNNDSDKAYEIAFSNFVQGFTVRRSGQSYVVEISFSSPDPTQARKIANATASAYLAQSVSFKAEAARNGGEIVQGRVNALAAQAQAAWDAVKAGRIPDRPIPDADARIIGAALQPLSKSAPRSGLIVAFGSVLSAVSGVFIAVVASSLDRSVRTIEDVRRYTGLPCLGVIPQYGRRSPKRRIGKQELSTICVTDPTSDFAIAIRNLRTSLMISAGQASTNTSVAFTSWSSNAGTSLISSNLSQVVRSSGHAVYLIDADVHRTNVNTSSKANIKTTLTDILLGKSDISEDVFSTPGEVFQVAARSEDSEQSFDVYLGAPEMKKVIGFLQQLGEVFIDLPPVSLFEDSRAGAAYADGTVIIAEAGVTTKDDLLAVCNALQHANATILGVVLNRTSVMRS